MIFSNKKIVIKRVKAGVLRSVSIRISDQVGLKFSERFVFHHSMTSSQKSLTSGHSQNLGRSVSF